MSDENETQALLGEIGINSSTTEDASYKQCALFYTRSTLHRYICLAFICIIGLGTYFCAESTTALQDHFLKDLNISETKFMSFYSNVQWVSIASCIFGGYLIDRIFGNRLGITLFSILVACAHAVFSVGALLNSYWIMFVSRAFYGLVNGPMSIATQNMAVKWFKSSNINMVFGLQISTARVSSVIVINVMGTIYDYFGQFYHGHVCLGITLFIGVVVAFLSFVASVVVSAFDRRADRMDDGFINVHNKDGKSITRVSDVKDFPATYWLVSLTTTCYYLALFPFVGLGQMYYEMKYEKKSQDADHINSMVYLMAAITMPIFGLLIDKLGWSLIWMFVGIILSIGSHFILAFTFLEPYIATITLGLGYSIFTAAVWPMVSFVVAFSHLGTAYGIMSAMDAVGQSGSGFFAGYLVDNYGYFVLEVFFTACMIGALILGSLLYIVDKSRGGDFNLSSKERMRRSELGKGEANKKEDGTLSTAGTIILTSQDN